MNRILILTLILTIGLGLSLTGCKDISRLVDRSSTVFVVEIVTNDPNRADIISHAITITESKINAVGLDGEVARSTDRDDCIEVKIFGSRDLTVLRKFLFTTYRLELKAVVSPPSPNPVQLFPSKEKAEKVVTDVQQVLPFPEREGSAAQFVIIHKEAIVTGEHIRSAYAVSRTGSDFDYQISFMLNRDGAARFGDWTGKNIGNYLAVVLDDEVQSIAFIKTQIFDSGEITGRFTKESAEAIALSLNSGYMPATMKIIEERAFE